MAAAAGVFANHHSRANLAHDTGATVASNKKPSTAAEARGRTWHFVRFSFN